jgi:hypothetical protein
VFPKAILGSKVLADVARGATASAVTQGLGVATGLQDRFSWTGVAVSAIGAGVGGAVGRELGFNPDAPFSWDNAGAGLAAGMAGGLAQASARSLIDGSDFGDNLMAELPSIIGNTVGNLLVGGIQRQGVTAPGAQNSWSEWQADFAGIKVDDGFSDHAMTQFGDMLRQRLSYDPLASGALSAADVVVNASAFIFAGAGQDILTGGGGGDGLGAIRADVQRLDDYTIHATWNDNGVTYARDIGWADHSLLTMFDDLGAYSVVPGTMGRTSNERSPTKSWKEYEDAAYIVQPSEAAPDAAEINAFTIMADTPSSSMSFLNISSGFSSKTFDLGGVTYEGYDTGTAGGIRPYVSVSTYDENAAAQRQAFAEDWGMYTSDTLGGIALGVSKALGADRQQQFGWYNFGFMANGLGFSAASVRGQPLRFTGASRPVFGSAPTPDPVGVTPTGRILFGQRRVGPTFGPKGPSYLAGRTITDVAADLRAGRLNSDQLPVEAFWYGNRLVSANSRSLAALSEAGLAPTRVTVIEPPRALLDRLNEKPIILGAPLPGPSVPVTPSQLNPYILQIINLPE